MSDPARRIPLHRWLQKQQRRTWLISGLWVLLLVALLMHRPEHEASRTDRWEGAAAQLDAVVDAVTFRLVDASQPARATHVRLLGVETPDGEAAEAARRWLEQAAQGRTLTLTFDGPVDRLADDGTMRAYVYSESGLLFTEALIQHGLARADPHTPHALSRWFELLEQRARSRRLGIWRQASAGKDDL